MFYLEYLLEESQIQLPNRGKADTAPCPQDRPVVNLSMYSQ